jgi:zinc transport system permease protein
MEEFGFWESWFVWRDAMIVALLSAAALAYLGVWVVLKRMVFVPLALSQVSSFGLLLATFLGGLLGGSGDPSHGHEWSMNPAWLSMVVAVVMGLWLARPREEGSQAVVSTYLFSAAGVLLLGEFVKHELHDVQAILFGSAVLVETSQIFWVGGAALIVALVHALFYRRFLFVSFDRDAAGAAGIPPFPMEALLVSTFALMISVATQAIGALPAFGLMVLPGMFALRMAQSMRNAFILALLLGLFSAGFGYYFSFRFGTPTGASMVGLSALAYGLALLVPKRN